MKLKLLAMVAALSVGACNSDAGSNANPGSLEGLRQAIAEGKMPSQSRITISNNEIKTGDQIRALAGVDSSISSANVNRSRLKTISCNKVYDTIICQEY